ncbi:MAG TPA: glycosyltransferase family 9 protein [Gemmatimonadales bacterium]|nr:glycosyltransferase family 9 protein [Gemmatimonadales bacterium]
MARSLLKRVRQGIKLPIQMAFARVAVLPLDRRPRTPRDLDGLEPRRIVVSRTDRIGDLLCGSPVLVALHQRWPAARLVVIAGPKNRAVLRGFPFVEAGPVFRRDPASWTELAWWLRRQRFDICVSLRAESMAGVWIAAWSGAPVRIVTHATKAGAAFNLILGADDAHQTTRYCHAAAILGFPPAEVRPVFVVPPEAERRVEELLPAGERTDGAPLVGLQIPHRSTKRYTVRAWPVEKVVALARALTGDGCRVMLCGTGSEREEAEYVRTQVPAAVLAPAGVSLAEFAAIQSRFDLFISQFTGTLHLADAVGVPTVSFGTEEQVEVWGVLGDRHRCIPAPRVADVAVDTVLDAARALLAVRRR